MFAFLLFSSLSQTITIAEKGFGTYELEITPHEYKELFDAVITVLFKNGKCLDEINDISDAIVHSRSGCAKDLPAGPRLYREMADFDNYKEKFDPINGTFVNHLKQQVAAAAKNADKGTVTTTPGLSYVCWCITLGGYSFKPDYSIDFNCQMKDGKRVCAVDGVMKMSGQDYWDFDDVPSYGWLKNIIEEKIPKWLVELRGKNMKPFYTKYHVETPYKFEIEVPK